MKDPLLPAALREMQADLRKPVIWLALFGIGTVLAMAGAFGTGDVMRPFPLVLYWVGVVGVTFWIGNLISTLCRHLLHAKGRALRVTAQGLIIGLTLSVFIGVVNTALFGTLYDTLSKVLVHFGTVTGVSFIVAGLLDYGFGPNTDQTRASPQDAVPTTGSNAENDTGPALLDRLPFDKRGPLIALSVEDHYVRVRTTKGEEMLLMRLGDAIRETAPVDGLQVHRSHWVATAAIQTARREDNRAILTMTQGPEIPASRANLPALKERGLL